MGKYRELMEQYEVRERFTADSAVEVTVKMGADEDSREVIDFLNQLFRSDRDTNFYYGGTFRVKDQVKGWMKEVIVRMKGRTFDTAEEIDKLKVKIDRSLARRFRNYEFEVGMGVRR